MARTVNPVRVQLRSIHTAVAQIERAVAQLAATINGHSRFSSAGAANYAPRKLKLSAGRKAQLKLQGAYMGHMRRLGPRQKARVRALKESKGMHAAIGLAKRLS